MDTILRTILYEWRDRALPVLLPRDVKLDTTKRPSDSNATVVTGFRRVGKTYLVFAAIQELLRTHTYSRDDVVYINFEDERLPLQTDTLTNLLPAIQAVYGRKPKYLFLDELQVIPGWSKWVRRILDSEDIQLFITGSSSKLSSYELPTELRGRAWEVPVAPLSLAEFLRFKGITIDLDKLAVVPDEQARLRYLLDEYLKFGALPAVVLADPAQKQELLQSYFQTVVQREIGERHQIGNEAALRTLLKLVVNTNMITISKLYNTLKSLGIPVGKATIDNYLHYIEESYFMRQLPIYNASVVNQLNYARKVYFVDTGFITALSTKFSTNMGRLLENAVFNRLARQHDTVHYYKDDRDNEVDFVVLENGQPTALYQVCYDLSDAETRQRELRPLLRAGARLQCPRLYLVTVEPDTAGLLPPEVTVLTADRVL